MFLFESGIHAREWLSIASNVYFIDKLIKNFIDSDETVVKILKKYELHFIVAMNPVKFIHPPFLFFHLSFKMFIFFKRIRTVTSLAEIQK